MLETTKLSDDEERAVSPVIGVILMVAITVILAVVIAAFVLDLGDSVGQEAQAGVNIDIDESDKGNITVEVTSLGNADYVNVSGDVRDEDAVNGDGTYYADASTGVDWDDGVDPAVDPVDGPPETELSELSVGDVVEIGSADAATSDVLMGDNAKDSGTVTLVAVIEEDDVETQVASEDYEFQWENN